MNEYIWMVLTIVFVIISIYLKIKINRKNSLGLTLDEEIKKNKEELEKTKKEFEDTQNNLKSLLELKNNSEMLKNENIALIKTKEDLESKIESLKNSYNQILLDTEASKKELNNLKSDLSIYSEDMDLISLGLVPEPEYLFNNSDRYKAEIKIIRNNQAQLIKANEAVELPDSIAMISDDSYAKSILQGQAKLMLKSFNLECDALLTNLKATNYPATLERIERIANEIEKNSISLKAGLSNKYVELKFRECELQYQFKKLENEEKIEQAAIKEQLKEEAKVRAEAERLQREAEKEEEAVKRALDKARIDFEKASDEQKAKYEAILSNLQAKLKEAEEKNQRAISMAQQTKCGHVYIISNIGSFGENVFKIGMTRRLEPMDRVKELGDASVPFEFDVHAMIYSEDAPALEKRFHDAFGSRRANLVNLKKEFFYVSLDEIEDWSTEQGLDFKLTKLAEARSYRDSNAIRKRLKVE